jgi:hypothetical protein
MFGGSHPTGTQISESFQRSQASGRRRLAETIAPPRVRHRDAAESAAGAAFARLAAGIA